MMNDNWCVLNSMFDKLYADRWLPDVLDRLYSTELII